MNGINLGQLKQGVVSQMNRLRREARAHLREMAEADAPAGTMATAFAAGTLISTIPVPLLDMAVAAYVMRRFSRLPRAPFFSGMALANNLVMAPLYASTPRVGGYALGVLATHTPVVAPEAWLLRALVGYLIIAMTMALASFVVANTGFHGYQAVRRPATARPPARRAASFSVSPLQHRLRPGAPPAPDGRLHSICHLTIGRMHDII